MSPPKHHRWAILSAVMAICVLGVAMVITWTVLDAALTQERDFFLTEEQHRLNSVIASGVDQMQGRVAALSTLANVFSGRANRSHPLPATKHVSIVESFGKFGGSTNLLQQCSVAMWVTDSERATFEASAGQGIRQARPMNASLPPTPANVLGDVFPANAQSYYLPMVLTYPTRLSWALFGDFSQRSLDRAIAINRTFETGQPAAAAPLLTPSGWSVPLHQAILSSDDAGRPWDGFVGATISLDAFSVVFDSDTLLTGGVYVTLVDATADSRTLFSTLPDSRPDDLVTLASQTFMLAERVWVASACMSSQYMDDVVEDSVHPSVYWHTGGAIGVGVAALVVILVTQTRSRVAAQVATQRAKASEQTHATMLQLMNHELRNPLTVIQATIELLASVFKVTSDRECADLVECIEDASGSMQRALDDLLHASTLQQTPLHPSSFSIASLLRDVRHYASVAQHDRVVEWTAGPGLPSYLLADRRFIKQILVNLMCFAHGWRNEVRLGLHTVSQKNVSMLVCSLWDIPLPKATVSAVFQGRTVSADDVAVASSWKPTTSQQVHEARRGSSHSAYSSDDEFESMGKRNDTMALLRCRSLVESAGGCLERARTASGWLIYALIPVDVPARGAMLSRSMSSAGAGDGELVVLSIDDAGSGIDESIPEAVTPLDQTSSEAVVLDLSTSDTPQPTPASVCSNQPSHEQEASTAPESQVPTSQTPESPAPESKPVESQLPERKAQDSKGEEAVRKVSTKGRKGRRRRARRRKFDTASRVNGSDHNVVVVDDESLIRRVVKTQLRRVGVERVTALVDGDELMSTLELMEEPPTCVLLDIVMKRSNGVEVLEELRQHPKWAALPVYAMTSNIESAKVYEAAGFTGLLGKPFVGRHLCASLLHSLAAPGDRTAFFVASKS